MDPDAVSWQLSNDAVYRRRITGTGLFFGMRSPRTGQLNQVMAGVTVGSKLDIHAVRHAWLAARFEMPAIALQADNPAPMACIASYVVPSSATDALQWAERSVFVHEPSDQHPMDVLSLGDPADAQDIITCHVFPHRQGITDVYLRMAHVFFDAYGTFLALQCLLRHLANKEAPPISWGPEVARLPLESSILLGIKAEQSQLTKKGARDLARTREQYKVMQAVPGLSPAYSISPDPSRHLRAIVASIVPFSMEDSTRLFYGFKNLGYTVGTALCHAAGIARYRQIVDLIPELPPTAQMPLVIPISMRKHLAPAGVALTAPLSLGSCVLQPTVAELAHASESFKQGDPDKYTLALPSIEGAVKDVATTTDAMLYEGELIKEQIQLAGNLLPKYGTSWTTCSFLGPLDEGGYLSPECGRGDNRLVLTDPVLAHTSELHWLVLHAWTFRGRLYLKTTVNLNHYPKTAVQDFEHLWVDLLRQIMTLAPK